MIPDRNVSPDLQQVLERLNALERRFHAGCRDATPEFFEQLVAPQFWEVGASGRRYTRDHALQVLRERAALPPPEAWHMTNLFVETAGPEHYLLTYTLHQPERTTRRLTVWRHGQTGWQAIFHQGTLVAV